VGVLSPLVDLHLRLERKRYYALQLQVHLRIEFLVFLGTEELLEVLIHKEDIYSDSRNLILMIKILFRLAGMWLFVFYASNGLAASGSIKSEFLLLLLFFG